MESESIVDYLKSSLGKPWALLANSNGITITITKTGDETNLYPEWDEFYLLVCDICGIIIRPQALGKHLATKHRINVQQSSSNHNHSLPNKETSTIPSTTIVTPTKTPTPITIPTAPASIAKPTSKSNPTPIPKPTPKPPLVAAPITSPMPAPISMSVPMPSPTPIPKLTPTSKYQNRKWRNTYKVLRDAFL